MRKLTALAACAVMASGAIAVLMAAPGGGLPVSVRQAEKLARETLGPSDGWAAFSTGTTGGAAAAANHVYVVTTQNEFKAAIADKTIPARIILVVGTIDANVGAQDQPLSCGDYEEGTGYTLEAYLAAYDPAVMGQWPGPPGNRGSVVLEPGLRASDRGYGSGGTTPNVAGQARASARSTR